MISLRNALEQMAWADDAFFSFLQELPDDAWRAKAGPDEWHVAALTFHLVASTDWYRFQLGGPIQFSEEPTSIAEVRGLQETWREINRFLIAQADLDDEVVHWEEDGQHFSSTRATVLTQVLIHAVEHRAHIAWALKVNGFPSPDLEDFTAWAYEKRDRT